MYSFSHWYFLLIEDNIDGIILLFLNKLCENKNVKKYEKRKNNIKMHFFKWINKQRSDILKAKPVSKVYGHVNASGHSFDFQMSESLSLASM